MGTDYPVCENMTPNKEFNTMHSTSKVLSSMGTIINEKISLTKQLPSEFIMPHSLRMITIYINST